MRLPGSLISVLAVVGLCLVVLTWLGLSSEPKLREPPPELLARDGHYEIGGERLVLPIIATSYPRKTFDLARYRGKHISFEEFKKRFYEETRGPKAPKSVQSLQISLRYAAAYGKARGSRELCPLLTREWARHICRSIRPGQLTNAPFKFALYERAFASEALSGHWTVGNERRSDQIAGMMFAPGVPEIGCDKASKFCTAGMAITPRLVAVWSVWPTDDPPESALDMARRQGQAILQLVRHGFGENERFAEVIRKN